MDIKSEGYQKPSDGALLHRDHLSGPSKLGDRSCSIMINCNARAATLLDKGGKTDTPSIAPSSLRNIASSDCASSAAKNLKNKILWSAHAHVNVRKHESQKWALHGKTLVIVANSRQVNTLLHPDVLEHALSADA